MKLFFLLAWKNLWRNKKRTLIALASIFFAVILSLLTRSMQHGSYDTMIKSYTRIYTGHVRVQAEEFWDKPSLDKSIPNDKPFLEKINSNPLVQSSSIKIESFILASSGNNTKASYLYGIVPVSEMKFSELHKKIVAGKFLNETSTGILISEGLSENLNAGAGDSIILYGQGYHGITAAAQMKIEGIVKYTFPENNAGTVVMTLRQAQQLLGMEGMVSSISILLHDENKSHQLISKLKTLVGSGVEVKYWEELMPELKQSIEFDSVSGIVMLFILYVVIGFGIFGTIMMMTLERLREFGVMISLGMNRGKLILVSATEAFLLSAVGSFAGALGAYPLLLYLYYHPIPLTGDTAEAMLSFGMDPVVPFSLKPGIFVAQIATVFLISLISAVYPFLVIRKLEPSQTFRK